MHLSRRVSDEPLADALRKAARGDETVQLTDADRPSRRDHPDPPRCRAPSEGAPSAVGVKPSDDARDDGRGISAPMAVASAVRRPVTETYVVDPVENERVLERRRKLVEEFGKHFPHGIDAVKLVREARRGYRER